MSPEKIIRVVEVYEERLRAAGIPKAQIDTRRTFASLSISEMLSHAHFLTDGAKEYAKDPERQRKAGSYLTSIQMCLSFAGWYTLEELMNHNRN